MPPEPTDRRLVLWICLSFAVLAAAAATWHVPWHRLVRLPAPTLLPATPAEIAAAQAAYDRLERNKSRGDRFYALTHELDRTGRGRMTEQQIVQRLGTPDGQYQRGTSRMIVYYYAESGPNDSYAAAVFNNALVHFGYNASSQLPASQLRPYAAPAPATGPSTAPATSPATTRPAPGPSPECWGGAAQRSRATRPTATECSTGAGARTLSS